MRHTCLRLACTLVAAAFIAACHSSSPVAPSAAPTTTTATPFVFAGRVVEALSGAAVPAVTISLDDGASAVTETNGTFAVSTRETGVCSVTATGPGMVSRQTAVQMPSSNSSISLISSQFDLATYDEMYRPDGTLHRWSNPPALVVVDAVLQFTNESDASYLALGERLTAEERASIVTDLQWGLARATGGAFGAFASVTVDSPAQGAPVSLSRPGAIVVARFSGLSRKTSYWGYGRASRQTDELSAAAILLDRDFDRAATTYGRSLRVHELGHALGCTHVTRRASFMNASATIEPNDFDHDAGTVAYQRRPGNQSPDRDPAQTAARSALSPVWSVILP